MVTMLSATEAPLQAISIHAIDSFCQRVDSRREIARVTIYRMYRASRPAIRGQLMLLHIRIEEGATYRFSSTGLGDYLLVMKDGVLKTLWRLE